MPVGSGERSKKGVERLLGAVNGSLEGLGRGLLLGRMGYKFACSGSCGVWNGKKRSRAITRSAWDE